MIYCGYSLEASLHRGASNEYPQHIFFGVRKYAKTGHFCAPLISSYAKSKHFTIPPNNIGENGIVIKHIKTYLFSTKVAKVQTDLGLWCPHMP